MEGETSVLTSQQPDIAIETIVAFVIFLLKIKLLSREHQIEEMRGIMVDIKEGPLSRDD